MKDSVVTESAPAPRQPIRFIHPDSGNVTDRQAQARVDREAAEGEYFAEGVQQIKDGEDPNPIILNCAKHVTDISDTNARHATLLDAANDELLTDEQTEVGNQKKFMRDLEEALKEGNVGLLMLDLDGFRNINTVQGHPAGDAAIVWFNKLLDIKLRNKDSKGAPRTPDEIYRLHGDEHAILVHNVDQEKLKEVAERIRKTVEEGIFIFEGVTHSFTTSIGGLMLDEQLGSLGNVRSADIALYKAKKNGRNQSQIVAIYDPPEVGIAV